LQHCETEHMVTPERRASASSPSQRFARTSLSEGAMLLG